jgi:hypothetical protein
LEGSRDAANGMLATDPTTSRSLPMRADKVIE